MLGCANSYLWSVCVPDEYNSAHVDANLEFLKERQLRAATLKWDRKCSEYNEYGISFPQGCRVSSTA